MAWLEDLVEEFKKLPQGGKIAVVGGGVVAAGLGLYAYSKRSATNGLNISGIPAAGTGGGGGGGAGGTGSPISVNPSNPVTPIGPSFPITGTGTGTPTGILPPDKSPIVPVSNPIPVAPPASIPVSAPTPSPIVPVSSPIVPVSSTGGSIGIVTASHPVEVPPIAAPVTTYNPKPQQPTSYTPPSRAPWGSNNNSGVISPVRKLPVTYKPPVYKPPVYTPPVWRPPAAGNAGQGFRPTRRPT